MRSSGPNTGQRFQSRTHRLWPALGGWFDVRPSYPHCDDSNRIRSGEICSVRRGGSVRLVYPEVEMAREVVTHASSEKGRVIGCGRKVRPVIVTTRCALEIEDSEPILQAVERSSIIDSSRMRRFGLRVFVAILATFGVVASALPATQRKPLFTFHSNAWLNLHLFVRLAARGVLAQAELSEQERAQWVAGVEFYKPYGQRDVLFDQGMVDIGTALRRAEGKSNLDGITIDADLKATLERLMPVYQKHWWPAHDRANRAWIAAAQLLIEQHGAEISEALARTYGVSWPTNPIPVDVTVTAGANGAYTSNNPTQISISSSEEGNRGYRALEIVFHESSHGLGLFPVLIEPLNQTAAEQKVTVPPQLWHAILFFTAGEITRRELSAHGIDYTEYAGAGLYKNLCGTGCRDKIAEHWTPHLDGKRSIADALSALVASLNGKP